MALQSSGQITLDDIHVEAGGTSGTLAQINDADIRGLISASASTEIQFADFYGASSGPEFVGAVTRKENDESEIDSSGEAINLTGAGVQVGDLVVIAITADIGDYTSMTVQGMSMTQAFNSGDNFPAALVFYGFWAANSSNPYLDGSGSATSTNRLRALSLVAGIFRGTRSSLLASASNGNSTGMPNPPSVGGSIVTTIVICTGHFDDDRITMTAPSGYTLAGSIATDNATSDNITGSSTGMAFKITTETGPVDPFVFGGGGNDHHNAVTLRF